MKTLSKIKKDFGAGVMYVPCECSCSCDSGSYSIYSSTGRSVNSANYKLAN